MDRLSTIAGILGGVTGAMIFILILVIVTQMHKSKSYNKYTLFTTDPTNANAAFVITENPMKKDKKNLLRYRGNQLILDPVAEALRISQLCDTGVYLDLSQHGNNTTIVFSATCR